MSSTATDESKVGGGPDEVRPRLKCYLQSDSVDSRDTKRSSDNPAIETIYLVQEEGKKSSFLLESPASTSGSDFYSIPTPSVIVVEVGSPHSGEFPFFLGGFQVVSTAKSVEVYLTDKEGQETYLMTSKGIPFMKEDTSAEWHKAICVVPGGPRPISKLRIKLLSLRPPDAGVGKLQSMKLTARIAEPPSPNGASSSAKPEEASPTDAQATSGSVSDASPSNCTTSRNSFQGKQISSSPESEPLTQSDLGAAMAGVSFLARSMGKEINDALQEQTERLELHVESCFTRMEHQMHSLKSILVVQQQLLQENLNIMQQQQQRIDDQKIQLGELMKHQRDLQVRVQSLQADVSILRYQAPHNIDEDYVHDFENDEKVHSEVVDDGYKIGENIPGVVIPLEKEDVPTFLGPVHDKQDDMSPIDNFNPHDLPLGSTTSEKASALDSERKLKDKTSQTTLLSPNHDPPAVNKVITPDEYVETANEETRQSANRSSFQQKKYYQKGDNDELCNFVANIEVTLVEDDLSGQAEDENDDDGEKNVTIDKADGFNDDTHIHEEKALPLDHSRQEFHDTFAGNVQKEEQLAGVNASPAWPSTYHCIPSTVEDAIV